MGQSLNCPIFNFPLIQELADYDVNYLEENEQDDNPFEAGTFAVLHQFSKQFKVILHNP